MNHSMDRRSFLFSLGGATLATPLAQTEYLKFQEMRDGVWLAQWEDKLPQLNLPKFPSLQWQYDKPYVLRLEMSSETIIATVEERGGQVLWKGGYRLRMPAVMDGRPGITAGGFLCEYRDFHGSVDQTVESPRKQPTWPPFTGGGQEPTFDRTGFFQVRQRDSRWWLVDPLGGRFISVGLCTIAADPPGGRPLIEKRFGSVEKWEADFRAAGAMRGIGWVVLFQDKEGGRLFNQWINEHDVGNPAGATPIFVMDVFEHAFMVDYGLKRADYIAAFFRNVNWKAAEARLS